MTENLTAVATKIDWSSLSGVILDGGYELKDLVDGRDQAAKLRVHILGSGGKTALAYFMHLPPADLEDQLDIWTTLKESSHPNLNRPVALGKREINGLDTVYMVLPDADEKLAAVVPERPLEWEEAAEVLHSCEKGLAHLHAHGLLHGAVSPRTIEAVGYSVQVNTENVFRIGKTPRVQWSKPQYLAPESKELNLTTAADVWCLGAALFEVLSQEPYGTPGAELEKGLPLAAVVQRCLDKNPATRCTLKDASTLEQSANLSAPPPAAVLPQPVAAPVQPSPSQPAGQKVKPANGTAPVLDPLVPPPPPSTGAARSAKPSSASRIPQPLTPKEPPKQVTKEDMALVPISKRHKKVKRQPVDARIRTLDGPDQDPAESESTSTALGPAVSARITALGAKSTLLRNIAAVVGFTAIFLVAVWLIVIPKLKSIDPALSTPPPIQVDAIRTDAPFTPAPPPPIISPLTNPSSQNGSLPAGAVTSTSSSAPSAPASEPAPAPRPDRSFFRVILGAFSDRLDAEHARDAVAPQHPELILQISRMKLEGSDEPKFVLAVGGILGSSDAQPLMERLQAKGLKTAHLERVVK